ncbi:hypothetical protein AB0C33_35995 [Nonomuraea sp. NPDC048881]|uniref:hypothetical protein n=1 Tax=Nonomuraea sp. NPDC048881 TaxID=3155030 RepID=UPI00340E4A4F
MFGLALEAPALGFPAVVLRPVGPSSAEQAHAEVAELRAELRAELERRITAGAEALADQTLLRSLTVEGGSINLDLIPPREIAAVWVHCAIGMLGDARTTPRRRSRCRRCRWKSARPGRTTATRSSCSVSADSPHTRPGSVPRPNGTSSTLAEAVRQRDELRDLIRELSDSSPCRFDHDGGCQEHGPTSTWDGCPHADAQKLLAQERT